MIVGGYHWYPGRNGEIESEIFNDTILIAPDPDNPVPDCLRPQKFMSSVADVHGGTDKGALIVFLRDAKLESKYPNSLQMGFHSFAVEVELTMDDCHLFAILNDHL